MAIKKYLKNYAEPESQLANFPLDCHYSSALVIPAYNESGDFIDNLEHLHSSKKFLLVLIINQPEDSPACLANDRLEEHLQQHFSTLWQDPQQPITLFEGKHFDILRVSRFRLGNQIPIKQGVGLARKIGADIVCQLIEQDQIDSPWIFSSDADAMLPSDYFDSANQQQAAALIYPHQHIGICGGALSLAAQLYDRSLDYYVAGLYWAGSPYAFHTIGSCIAIDYQRYTQVRGFPRRAGGEDFYLLNKIRKTGEIISLNSSRIKLLARESDRVPFGTGPALKKINAYETPEKDYLFYHPWLFHYLQCWLNVILQLWPQQMETTDIKNTTEELIIAAAKKPIDASILIETLSALGYKKAIEHAIKHSNTEGVFLQHMMNWFDGFKTLKFLHFLRDQHLPSIPWGEVISIESFYQEEPG